MIGHRLCFFKLIGLAVCRPNPGKPFFCFMTKWQLKYAEQMQHPDVRRLHWAAKIRDNFICQNFGEARERHGLGKYLLEACEDPTAKVDMHAHHLGYPPFEVHLKETPLSDLITLCVFCHSNFHRSPEDFVVQTTMWEALAMEHKSLKEAQEKQQAVQDRHTEEIRKLWERGHSNV